MIGGGDARRGVIDRARLGFRQSDEFLQVLGRQVLAHHHHLRSFGDDRHRHQILRGIEGHGAIEELIDGHHAVGDHRQRVAIGRGLRHLIRADIAAGTGTIVDGRGLAGALADIFGDDTAEIVGRPTGRIRNDDADLFRGPGFVRLRHSHAWDERQPNGETCRQTCHSPHGILPCFFLICGTIDHETAIRPSRRIDRRPGAMTWSLRSIRQRKRICRSGPRFFAMAHLIPLLKS